MPWQNKTFGGICHPFLLSNLLDITSLSQSVLIATKSPPLIIDLTGQTRTHKSYTDVRHKTAYYYELITDQGFPVASLLFPSPSYSVTRGVQLRACEGGWKMRRIRRSLTLQQFALSFVAAAAPEADTHPLAHLPANNATSRSFNDLWRREWLVGSHTVRRWWAVGLRVFKPAFL